MGSTRLGGEHKTRGVALYIPRRKIQRIRRSLPQGRLGREHKARVFALYTHGISLTFKV
jgi:hypothetical protein